MRPVAQEVSLLSVRPTSLLNGHLPEADYQDTVELHVPCMPLTDRQAEQAMEWLLQGFVEQPPSLISSLMCVRNQFVRPLGLRRSRLGCPVSSLLSDADGPRFAGRYPVLDSRVDHRSGVIELILGADDKHLRFRSCVGLAYSTEGCLVFSLATRVQTQNAFGRFYMRTIHALHHRLISPLMLRRAVDYVWRRFASTSESDAQQP